MSVTYAFHGLTAACAPPLPTFRHASTGTSSAYLQIVTPGLTGNRTNPTAHVVQGRSFNLVLRNNHQIQEMRVFFETPKPKLNETRSWGPGQSSPLSALVYNRWLVNQILDNGSARILGSVLDLTAQLEGRRIVVIIPAASTVKLQIHAMFVEPGAYQLSLFGAIVSPFKDRGYDADVADFLPLWVQVRLPGGHAAKNHQDYYQFNHTDFMMHEITNVMKEQRDAGVSFHLIDQLLAGPFHHDPNASPDGGWPAEIEALHQLGQWFAQTYGGAPGITRGTRSSGLFTPPLARSGSRSRSRSPSHSASSPPSPPPQPPRAPPRLASPIFSSLPSTPSLPRPPPRRRSPSKGSSPLSSASTVLMLDEHHERCRCSTCTQQRLGQGEEGMREQLALERLQYQQAYLGRRRPRSIHSEDEAREKIRRKRRRSSVESAARQARSHGSSALVGSERQAQEEQPDREQNLVEWIDVIQSQDLVNSSFGSEFGNMLEDSSGSFVGEEEDDDRRESRERRQKQQEEMMQQQQQPQQMVQAPDRSFGLQASTSKESPKPTPEPRKARAQKRQRRFEEKREEGKVASPPRRMRTRLQSRQSHERRANMLQQKQLVGLQPGEGLEPGRSIRVTQLRGADDDQRFVLSESMLQRHRATQSQANTQSSQENTLVEHLVNLSGQLASVVEELVEANDQTKPQ